MLIKKIMFYKILITIFLTNSTAFANSNDYFYLQCSTHNIDISLPYLYIKAALHSNTESNDATYFRYSSERWPEISQFELVNEAYITYPNDFVYFITKNLTGRESWSGWLIDRELGKAIYYTPILYRNPVRNRLDRVNYFIDNVDRSYNCNTTTKSNWDNRYSRVLNASEIDANRQRELQQRLEAERIERLIERLDDRKF